MNMSSTSVPIIIVAIVVIAVLGFGFFVGAPQKNTEKGDSPVTAHRQAEEKTSAHDDLARIAAQVSLTDYDGVVRSLEDYRGKPLIINSWALWCPFCRNELPDFATLQSEFADRITIIGIDRQEPRKQAKGYTDELGITDKMVFLLDSSDGFYHSIGGFSMPETVFINVDGTIVFHKRGPMSLEEMRAAVAQYLE